MAGSGLTPAQMDDLIAAHFRYEADRDLDSLLAGFTEDAEHDAAADPNPVLVGREAIRPRYDHAFENFDVGSMISHGGRLYGDDFAVTIETWTGHVIGEFAGFPGKGREVSFRVLHVFEFDGLLIKTERVWVDSASLIAQLQA